MLYILTVCQRVYMYMLAHSVPILNSINHFISNNKIWQRLYATLRHLNLEFTKIR
jgi:hypothetical protein